LKVATALREVGAEVVIHDDRFPQDAPDETWLKAAGEFNWVVLTKDKNIRYRTREMHALVAHGVRAFVLTAKALNAEEMAAIFITSLPRIASFLASHRGPFMATISRSGAVNMVWPTAAGKK
jgi:predicted nuclease of predicted toxin-antitoxin system